ncbi:MBL fold metallo-hydrolase [Zunongwangia profunda]|uniref:Metallo-beta-lactamase domain-containing protein n=2 Tax=Zunongwangia profunda TaxID=398743 RepID=D5BE98_ZUNPS|nr:MBL fold metallo-hydrolase [Zunongwangia profunda]ADF52857.1 metallo-beta-lactamase domain-containing protein [Zunongwangia profunda SM-A87]MAS72716.1 MBL fold metallo-hydrolase [Zunongwangia sp.]HCV80103.1 MBL fold metallo-hydrolase [Zunongwangia profunda]
MKVTFLGTGTSQGIPIIGSTHPVCLSKNPKDKRLRVSVMVEWEGLNILIDCGPDFRMQMLANNFARLDAILFTHEHNDHVAGLDDIRPFFFRQGNIPIYAHERVLNALKKRFDYIFVTENKYPGAPGVNEHIVTDNDFEIQGKHITPVSYLHNQLQVYGYRMGGFAYLTDIKSISETEAEKLKNLEVVVVSALRVEPHHSHFNLAEALEFIEKIKPNKTYLTHISHLLGFHDEVEQSLPENVHLAYDNLKISIDEK